MTVHLSPDARRVLAEVVVRVLATAWVLGFVAAVEAALPKLQY